MRENGTHIRATLRRTNTKIHERHCLFKESAETVAPNCDGIYQNGVLFAFQLKLRGKKSSIFFLSACLRFSYFITSEIGSAQAQYCTLHFQSPFIEPSQNGKIHFEIMLF